MATRSQQSFFRPIMLDIDDGDTTPNPGVVNSMALSSVTLGFMRWTGTIWTAVRAAPRALQAYVDFGHANGGESDNASVTVVASWVTASSPISCSFAGQSTADHDPEDASLEELQVLATNRVPGVGFDIAVYAPHGTWGRHLVTATG